GTESSFLRSRDAQSEARHSPRRNAITRYLRQCFSVWFNEGTTQTASTDTLVVSIRRTRPAASGLVVAAPHVRFHRSRPNSSARVSPLEMPKVAPHDLRRSCARFCHAAGGELEQIQFLLGHVSVQTTERYLGCKQRF